MVTILGLIILWSTVQVRVGPPNKKAALCAAFACPGDSLNEPHEDAIEVTAQHLGLIDPALLSITVETPMGNVTILRSSICHCPEHRL